MPDRVEQRVLDDIARFGWHLIQINADEAQPGFVYSVGMMETLGHPEIILFGLAPKLMGTVINDMGRQVRTGRNFAELGLFEDLLEGYACKIIRVHERRHPEYLGYAMWHRRHVGKIGTLEGPQCVRLDKSGKSPGAEELTAEVAEDRGECRTKKGFPIKFDLLHLDPRRSSS